MNCHIEALHAASLAVATHLMADLPDLERDVLLRLVQGGAQLAIEVHGLPACQNVCLVAIEREGGRRYPVAKVSLSGEAPR